MSAAGSSPSAEVTVQQSEILPSMREAISGWLQFSGSHPGTILLPLSLSQGDLAMTGDILACHGWAGQARTWQAEAQDATAHRTSIQPKC